VIAPLLPLTDAHPTEPHAPIRKNARVVKDLKVAITKLIDQALLEVNMQR